MYDKLLTNVKMLSKKSQQVYNHVQDNEKNIDTEYIKHNLDMIEAFIASTKVYMSVYKD